LVEGADGVGGAIVRGEDGGLGVGEGDRPGAKVCSAANGSAPGGVTRQRIRIEAIRLAYQAARAGLREW
jgi:hypothetical protein